MIIIVVTVILGFCVSNCTQKTKIIIYEIRENVFSSAHFPKISMRLHLSIYKTENASSWLKVSAIYEPHTHEKLIYKYFCVENRTQNCMLQ